MAIASYSQSRVGDLTTITVVSDLLPAAVYYHWYVDGWYVGPSGGPAYSLHSQPGDQVRIVCQDTTDPDYDAAANTPAGWPARRTLWWVRATDLDLDYYRVEQKLGAGAFTTIGRVSPRPQDWSLSLLTPRLTDLGVYTWRITPVDKAGNEGTAITIGPETIVRTPEAPDFTVSFDPATTRVTFSAAA